jgi:peptide/nickel transport system substrate-binding protein
MFKKSVFVAFSLLMVATMVLSACAPQVQEVIKTVEVQVEKEVVTTVEVEKEVVKEVETIVEVTATPEPVTRTGGWLDSIVIVEEPSQDAGVARTSSGEFGVYMYTISNAELFKNVQADANLAYSQSFGSYNEISFNPAGPVFEGTGKLNPFAVPAIREAMNYLVDRTYITQEIMGGLGVPRFLAVSTGFADYARYADLARAIEAKYAYNVDKAKEIVDAEMTALGATLTDGKWTYEGEPVTLVFLIRVEDERRAIGDYMSNQLETLGFTVDRQYKTSAEASPIWLGGDPNAGEWNVYTGGWVTTAISRDDGSNFSFFYTNLGLGRPLWQAYVNTPEFYEVATKLLENDFANLDERRELFAQAFELSMQDSNRIWIADRRSFTPRGADVSVTGDLAGAVYGSTLWARTLRYVDEVGGEMTLAMPSILTQAWNPLGGSNWIYDSAIQRAVSEYAVHSDPFTGLAQPNRVEKAEIVVQEGLPVGKTLDWVSLEFAPTIEVPADAWVDWDAENQVFITAGEAYTQTQTALYKSTVYYEADLFDKMTWHDGTPLSMADFVMGMILTFDPNKEASAIYDEAGVPAFNSFMSIFKGVKVVSTDPLVIETYRDDYNFDAENMVISWFPNYGFGEASWYAMVPAIRAEAAGKLAFTEDKATANELELTNFIGGPSLEILKTELISATAESYVPYAPTMSGFLTAEEAVAAYTSLDDFFKLNGHFWVNLGPYYVDKIFPVEGTVTLRRYAAYPDPADKWSAFSAPKLSEVAVDGPGRVGIGEEAKFTVSVTYQGAAYPQAEIAGVTYLVFDATGALATKGEATAVADGQYEVTLPADVTKALTAGANKLEVVVVSGVVSIPSFASFEFVTAAP